ncbi:MAG: glycosyltransferase family 9 protein [Candidatus Krumholzibacteriota bacterium]|nr:glycosyltransferase family 9 protein [Candidatus Krumholzibacteriota bacterium]
MTRKSEKRFKVILARLFSGVFSGGRLSPGEFRAMRIERLLVIRQHDQMGDMLLAVPALRALRKRYPTAMITFLASDVNSGVMQNNPYIDELIVWPKKLRASNIFALFGFVRALRKACFDAVIVLNTVSFSVTSMILAAISGATVRVGCSDVKFGHGLSSLYYHLELPLPTEAEIGGMHEGTHNLFPLRSVGIEDDDLSSVIVPTGSQIREAEMIMAAVDPKKKGFAMIHPGAGKEKNRWPVERFASVGRKLLEEYQIPVIAVRGPSDLEASDRLIEQYGEIPLLLSSPEAGLLSEIMRRSVVTICNDTGVMHIAGASGARVVAIFGPTESLRWKPASCSVTAIESRDGDISSVGEDEVFGVISSLLSGIREIPCRSS